MTRATAAAWADYLFCRTAFAAKRILIFVGGPVMLYGILTHDLSRSISGAVGLALGIYHRSRPTTCPLPPSRQQRSE